MHTEKNDKIIDKKHKNHDKENIPLLTKFSLIDIFDVTKICIYIKLQWLLFFQSKKITRQDTALIYEHVALTTITLSIL